MKVSTDQKRLWFKRKLYGWGWTPAAWQGWLVLLVYGIVLVCILTEINTESPAAGDILLGVSLPIMLLTTALIVICYRKGEKPRWQWGTDAGEDVEKKM